jgi:diguanylate cyclase (GGDEF)-like protein
METVAHLSKLRLALFFVIPGLATEKGQTIARLSWSVAFALYLYFSDRFQGTPEYAAAWRLSAIHFVFAVTVWALVRVQARSPSLRRGAVAVLDQLLFAVTLYLTGEISAPFIWMPLLLTFGTGLRYGRAQAVLCSTISPLFTYAALNSSSYWNQYPNLQVGLVAATILLPLYLFRLTDARALEMRTDSLTGLRNRIGFDELLDRACQGIVAAIEPSAIVLLDLDGFKQINDVHGHDGGDLVLKHVAHSLKTELKDFGVPARFGGDEFAIVVSPVKSSEELEAALARFLKRTVDVGQMFDSPLGASIGVYYLRPRTPVTPRFAFKAADQLMYRAKKLGKNQFVTSTGNSFSKNGELLAPSIDSSATLSSVATETNRMVGADQLDELVRSLL